MRLSDQLVRTTKWYATRNCTRNSPSVAIVLSSRSAACGERQGSVELRRSATVPVDLGTLLIGLRSCLRRLNRAVRLSSVPRLRRDDCQCVGVGPGYCREPVDDLPVVRLLHEIARAVQAARLP